MNIGFSISDPAAILVSNTLLYSNTVQQKMTGYKNWS